MEPAADPKAHFGDPEQDRTTSGNCKSLCSGRKTGEFSLLQHIGTVCGFAGSSHYFERPLNVRSCATKASPGQARCRNCLGGVKSRRSLRPVRLVDQSHPCTLSDSISYHRSKAASLLQSFSSVLLEAGRVRGAVKGSPMFAQVVERHGTLANQEEHAIKRYFLSQATASFRGLPVGGPVPRVSGLAPRGDALRFAGSDMGSLVLRMAVAAFYMPGTDCSGACICLCAALLPSSLQPASM